MLERLEELADQLRNKESTASAVLEEQTVRLLAAAAILLRQHKVNKRGRCQYCGWTGWARRLWYGRPQCTVYRALSFALGQRPEILWRQLYK